MNAHRFARFAAVLLLASGLGAGLASAVVISTGDGSGNTTAPPDDFGFLNVGVSDGGFAGVYLGDRWVLTAAHVAFVGFTFDGTYYPPVPDSRVNLETSPGVLGDIALIRIATAPPLPPVKVAVTAPSVTDPISFAGTGWTRDAAQTCWNGSFVEVNCNLPTVAVRGYKAAGGPPFTRWGNNLVSVAGSQQTIGPWTTKTFQAVFDQAGVTHEAQLVNGDSGGGVFLKRGAEWELVGINFSVLTFMGQPALTAAFGNVSLFVDVAHYASQIDAIMNPPPQVPLASAALLLLGSGGLLALSREGLMRRLRA